MAASDQALVAPSVTSPADRHAILADNLLHLQTSSVLDGRSIRSPAHVVQRRAHV
jgi:hypothetical protein